MSTRFSLRLTCAGALAAVALSGAPAAASTPHYVPGKVRAVEGFHFADADNMKPSGSVVRYRRRGHGTISVTTADRGPCCAPEYGKGRDVTVRGRPGRAGKLSVYDWGYHYFGRWLTWEERSGVWVTVISHRWEGLPVRTLMRVAQSLEPVSDSYWRNLIIGTRRDPYPSEYPAGRIRRVVAHGRANGHQWTLRALVPRRFPIGWFDLRTPCPHLSYRKRAMYSYECSWSARWQLMREQVFVFGVVPKRVRRVRLVPLDHPNRPGRVFKTIRRRSLGRHNLYVAAMPRNTCHVYLRDADRGTEYGPAGPLDNDVENKRCYPSATR